MRTASMFVFASLLVSGCMITAQPGPGGPNGSGGVPTGDGSQRMGAEGLPGYRVVAGGGAELPAGDLGYLVTANGTGGYRVAWSDTAGSAAQFSGSVTTDGSFDAAQLTTFGGASVQLSAANRIDFSSVPGAGVDGIDLVSSTDPIYLDALIDGGRSGFGLYFDSAEQGGVVSSAYDPVAFTSP